MSMFEVIPGVVVVVDVVGSIQTANRAFAELTGCGA
jgi:PAS domain-containing protein